MKNFKFFLLSILISGSALAQVNLDRPVTTGFSDKLFQSTVDPDVVYYFPVALVRKGEPNLIEIDEESVAAVFNLSYSNEDYKRVKSDLANAGKSHLKVRYLRPIGFQIDPGFGLDTLVNPKIEFLNDLSFDGSTQMMVSVNSKKRMFHRRSTRFTLFNQLFGSSQFDHLAQLKYEVTGISQGERVRIRTVLPVFVGERNQFSLVSPGEMFEKYELSSGHVILNDAQTGCWEQVKIGQICIRNE
jgi:hypothetical protein